LQLNFDANKNIVNIIIIYYLTNFSLNIAILNIYTIVKSISLLLQVILTNAIVNKFIVAFNNIV